MKNKIAIPLLVTVMLVGGMIAGSASMASAANKQGSYKERKMGITGTIASVAGSNITLTTEEGQTYTVDATNAKATKIIELTPSDLTLGETITVMGPLDGTSVSANHIMVGDMPRGHTMRHAPGVLGTVTGIQGDTFTISTKNDGSVYTVVAGDADIKVFSDGSRPTERTLSNILVGDMVGVYGEIDGTTITAKHIMDNLPEKRPMH